MRILFFVEFFEDVSIINYKIKTNKWEIFFSIFTLLNFNKMFQSKIFESLFSKLESYHVSLHVCLYVFTWLSVVLPFFWPEKIVVSFLNLMMLFYKVIINHTESVISLKHLILKPESDLPNYNFYQFLCSKQQKYSKRHLKENLYMDTEENRSNRFMKNVLFVTFLIFLTKTCNIYL